MGSQQFCLKWNNYHSNLSTEFKKLLSSDAYVDVTLACEGQSIKAHKMLLSACSPFFHELFTNNPCKHPIVILKDISYSDMKSILDYIYHGEVNVSNDKLSTFLKTAQVLRVKGLDSMDDNEDNSESHENQSAKNVPRPDSPKQKKRKRRHSSDSFEKDETPEKEIPAKPKSRKYDSTNVKSSNSSSYHTPRHESNKSSHHQSPSESYHHTNKPFQEPPQAYSSESPSHSMIVPEIIEEEDDDDCIFEQEMKPVINHPPSNDLPMITEPASSMSYAFPTSDELIQASASYGDDMSQASTSYALGNELVEGSFDNNESFDPSNSSKIINPLYQKIIISDQESFHYCPTCSYKSKYKHNVTKHLQIHSMSKPFKCNVCEYSVNTLKGLQTHATLKHLYCD